MPRGRREVPIGTRGRAKGGYVRIKVAHGHPMATSNRDWALEHRVVVHEAGIEVPPGYHVHHRNEIKDDNRLENLEVKPPPEHSRIGARDRIASGRVNRPSGTRRRTPDESLVLLRDPDWLASAYAEASTVEIAGRLETNRMLVRYWLRQHGIPIRARSEATTRQHARERAACA